ncbi:L-dopachrome tautomerase yellow-f2 [Sergentomyia squamirostris]
MLSRWCFIFLTLYVMDAVLGRDLEEIFAWKQLSFENHQTPSASDFIFMDNGMMPFIPYNNVPMGVTHHKGRLFITIPRRRSGVPSTLNVISLASASVTKSPQLRPYPDFERNDINSSLPMEERIISVYRSKMDTCDRLWFADTGRHEYLNTTVHTHSPTLWAIDTNTDRVVKRFPFPREALEQGAGTISLVVDIPNERDCGGAFVYIPDLVNGRIYVYSLRENRMWTFIHNYFRMDPHHGDLTIAGHQFQWDDGIFSIALGRRNSQGYRTAYFHPMISLEEFAVSTAVLRNESLARREYHGDDFRLLGKRGDNKQSTLHGFDETTGVMFYAEIGRNAVGCWNTDKVFAPENFDTVKQDKDFFIYPSDLSVDNSGRLWVLTNTMPRWLYSRLNINKVNFRVWSATTKKAIQGTVCEHETSPTSFRVEQFF